MTQQLKKLVAKPDTPDLIPGTHMLETEPAPHKLSPDFHMCVLAHMHSE